MEIPFGAAGCFAWSCSKVSALSGAIDSSVDNSRMVPLKSKSANLASTLFLRISSFGLGLCPPTPQLKRESVWWKIGVDKDRDLILDFGH